MTVLAGFYSYRADSVSDCGCDLALCPSELSYMLAFPAGWVRLVCIPTLPPRYGSGICS